MRFKSSSPSRSIHNRMTHGGALIVVILLSTVTVLGIGVAIKLSYERADRAKQEMHTRNLKEANKTVKQFIDTTLLDNMAYDIRSFEGTEVEDMFAEIQTNIALRFPEARLITLDPTPLLGMTLPGITQPVEPEASLDVTDPFRTSIAREGTLSDLSYDMYIGYGDENADGYINAEDLIGYQVEYTANFKARRIGPENFAWGHYGEEQDPNWTAKLIIETPEYLDPSNTYNNEVKQAKLMGQRSSSLMMLSNTLTNGVTVDPHTVDTGLTIKTFKPIFNDIKGIRGEWGHGAPKWRVQPAPNRRLLGDDLDAPEFSLLNVASSDNTQTGSFYEQVSGTSTSERGGTTEEMLKGALLTSREEVANRGKFVLFNDVADSVINQQASPESPPSKFWDTSYSWSSTEVYKPAHLATIRVDVDDEVVTGEILAKVYKQPSGLKTTTPAELDEDFVIYLDGVNKVRPRDANYATTVLDFLDPESEFWETYPNASVAGTPEGTTDEDWLQEFIDLESEFGGDPTLPGSVIKQSFLGGAIRLQRFPNSTSLPGYGVAVEMGRLPDDSTFPSHGYFTATRGIFVNVLAGDTSTPARQTAVRNLLNASMVLVTSDLNDVQGSHFFRRATSSTFGNDSRSASLPVGLLNENIVLGTNGRVVMDSAVNINRGVRVTQQGTLTTNGTGNLIDETDWTSLSPYYGALGLAPSASSIQNRSDTGGHRLVIASRLRPGVTYLDATTAPIDYALDPSVTNAELLFTGGTYNSTPFAGDFASMMNTPQVLMHEESYHPPFTPYNSLASGLLASSFGYYAPEGAPFLRTKDIPTSEGIDISSETVDVYDDTNGEAFIDGLLQSFAEQRLISVLSTSPYFAPAVAQRLASDDPALETLQNELRNINRDPTSSNALILNLGRQERRNFAHVFFQRYGYKLGVDDSFSADADYKFRPIFSGNIKQRVIRYCRVPSEDINDNGILDPGEDINGNGELDLGEIEDFDTPTQEYIFQAAQQARVVIQGDESVELVFRDCPAEELISVNTTAAFDPDANQDILEREYAPADRVGAFFYPVLTGAQGPASVEDLLLAYTQPDTSLADALASTPKLAPPTTADYLAMGGATYANGVTNSALVNAANNLLAFPLFTQGAISMGSDRDWSDILTLSPFFGRIQYTVAYSYDDPAMSQSAAYTSAPHQHKVKAYWTMESTALRLAQVKVEEYVGSDLTLSGSNTQGLVWDALLEDEQDLIVDALDLNALTAFESYMDINLYDQAQAESWVGHCVADIIIPLNEDDVQGGVLGRIELTLDPTVDSLGYDIYMDPNYGHETGTTHAVNYDNTISSILRVDPISTSTLEGEVLVEDGNRLFSPTYTIDGTATSVQQKVRGEVRVTRNRAIASAEIFEPLTSGLVSNIDGTNSNTLLLVNSASGLGLNMLSQPIRDALFNRTLTFKLYTNVSTTNVPPVPTQPSFAGVGTILTAANSPHPEVMHNLVFNVPANDLNYIFGWSGSIKTGIGTELDNTLHGALRTSMDNGQPQLLRTVISGDPMLTSRNWGSVGYAERLVVPELETNFNLVRKSR